VAKVKAAPLTDFDDGGEAVHTDSTQVWVPLRAQWRDIKGHPEELVRQDWIRRLVIYSGFDLTQLDQERRTQSGVNSPRVDIVVWESAADKSAQKTPFLVVECKAAVGEIIRADFYQGESYARAVGCEFLVAANSSTMASYRLEPGLPGKAVRINGYPTAADIGNAVRLNAIRNSLREFSRDEFQRLLNDCHNILRDQHAMTPDRAFDTISKILFIKLDIEREGDWGTFTTDYIDRRKGLSRKNETPIHDVLFEETKEDYKSDELFAPEDRLDISEATFREIVEKLQRFNLSKTGDDIKGIAFEKFLGTTFRGELGQFFTPRPVVDFIVDALDPHEGDTICDPAAGSGGFLIRCFEHVRSQIATELEEAKSERRDAIEAEFGPDDELSDEQRDERDDKIDEAFAEINEDLVASDEDGEPVDTRVGRLAWNHIYGCDKEPRAGRTAKMNMIMHGDGHGGIHWHDGLVDINGIFRGRFDIVITNPPFGASVNKSQLVGATTEADVPEDPSYKKRQKERYGDDWQVSHNRVIGARGEPVLNLFEIGNGQKSLKTEILFVERCLQLLRPGGWLGIILPNGNLNLNSTSWLRRWVEGRAHLRGVVTLPVETFKFSKASVSTSVVFIQRFTDEDAENWESAWTNAHEFLDGEFDDLRNDCLAHNQELIVSANGKAAVSKVLADLDVLGVKRVMGWSSLRPPAIERGPGTTVLSKPKWGGRADDAKKAAGLKRQYDELLSDAKIQEVVAQRTTAFKTEMKKLDSDHHTALWDQVRNELDYPIFVANPTGVGITATGDTGPTVPNDLPTVLNAWHEFKAWIESGADQDAEPCLS
jgi:type I restriction enzyme M protein